MQWLVLGFQLLSIFFSRRLRWRVILRCIGHCYLCKEEGPRNFTRMSVGEKLEWGA